MSEWAQLRAGPTTRTGLERGVWYRVESRRNDGSIRLLGPNATGVPLHISAVRIIDREPDLVTRIQTTEFHPVKSGERSPGVSYYGVCPQTHWIRDLEASDAEVRCPECGRTYPVEDEHG